MKKVYVIYHPDGRKFGTYDDREWAELEIRLMKHLIFYKMTAFEIREEEVDE